MDKEMLVKIAMDEAMKATQEGNSPFGAVLADMDGNIITTAHNTVNTETDPTAHAEMNLIRKASKMLGKKKLNGYILVSNVQSCPMCFSAAVRCGIKHFVYGCAEDETLVPKITVHEMKRHVPFDVEIETGVLEEECEKQLMQARTKDI